MMRELCIALCLAVTLAGCGEDGTDTRCSASNCAGCCTVNGDCVAGNTNSACGVGGAACTACQSGSCSAGACVATCDATTCPDGCCQGDQCMSGAVPTACGKGGQACVTCQSGELCTDGSCKSTTACDATSCPAGCCQSGQCMPGTTEAACGSGGVACQACQVPDETCENQVCTPGPTCDATTCPTGCCDAQAQCLPGNTDALCGTGGLTCEACPAGNTCTNQACTSPGGCGSCAGCCDGQTCQVGNTDTACGSGGVACEACPAQTSCVNNACEVKPDSDWGVTVVDGEIAKPPLGKIWDPNAVPTFQEPDVYVQLTSGGQSGQTKGDDNTYTPSWGEEVLTAKAQDLMQSLAITVMDEELFPPNELMAQCTVTITSAELIAGTRTVANCGGTDVLKINLSFTAK